MAKFRPIKKRRTSLERLKDKNLKNPTKKRFTNPKKRRKRKKTVSKREKKKKKGKEKDLFLNKNAFLSFPVPDHFDERTCLVINWL